MAVAEFLGMRQTGICKVGNLGQVSVQLSSTVGAGFRIDYVSDIAVADAIAISHKGQYLGKHCALCCSERSWVPWNKPERLG